MSIKSLGIETVFTGGIHLLWLTLIALGILRIPPDNIFYYLSKIEAGTAVLFLAILFSASSFLGRIAEHFLSAVNYFIRNGKRQEYADAFEGSKGGAWGNKIFSLSSFCGILILGIILCILVEGENVKCAILVVGSMLLLGTMSSFLYWYKLGKRLSKKTITKE